MPPGNANCDGSPVRSSWKGRNANENDNHTVLGSDLRAWPDGLCACSWGERSGPSHSGLHRSDVTKAEITHRAGGTVTEWTVEGDELDALKDWASGLKYELLDSEENPGDRDGGEV